MRDLDWQIGSTAGTARPDAAVQTGALATAPVPEYILSVHPVLHVSAPPAKPLLVYDGDCGFCVRWIGRWKRTTGEAIESLPFQDPNIAARFSEVPRTQFEAAIHLIQPDGTVHRGAGAVFQSLDSTRWRWLLKWYQRSTLFARLADWSYGFVARHRTFFSRLA